MPTPKKDRKEIDSIISRLDQGFKTAETDKDKTIRELTQKLKAKNDSDSKAKKPKAKKPKKEHSRKRSPEKERTPPVTPEPVTPEQEQKTEVTPEVKPKELSRGQKAAATRARNKAAAAEKKTRDDAAAADKKTRDDAAAADKKTRDDSVKLTEALAESARLKAALDASKQEKEAANQVPEKGKKVKKNKKKKGNYILIIYNVNVIW